MKKYLILIPIFLVVVVGAGIFGAMQVQKSKPSYSIDHIRGAISNHDYATFSSFVDVDKIINHAADEILMQQLAEDEVTTSMQELKSRFENQMKPEFIEAVKRATEEYVSTGRVSIPSNPNPTEKIIQQANVDSIHISRFGIQQADSGSAIARIVFADDELQTFFDLDAKLEKSGDGWHITDVDGWKKCVADYKLALKYKLDRLNEPIRDQIKNSVEIKIASAKIGEGDEYGFSKDLTFDLKIKTLTNAPIEVVRGRVVIDVTDQPDVYAPFEIYNPSGEQTIKITKVLSPFVKSEVTIMHHGIHSSDLSLETTQIVFADGSSLKLMEEIP